jgi:acetyl esterase
VALDPQVKTFLDQLAETGGPGIEDLSVDEARALLAAFSSLGGPGPEMAAVRDLAVPGPAGDLPVRVFTPPGAGDTTACLVWFHGGGWVLGSLDETDPVCRSLAAESGVVVASVGYRLAPEHPFPAAPEDCYAAVTWLASHPDEVGADTSRLAVGGDSAGGNLAAVTALQARDGGGPSLSFQLLVYPATDASTRYPSITENGEGYFLTSRAIDWFLDLYLVDPSRAADPLASPMRAADLSGLPPALVVTAEYDPLRDEGEAFARALEAAGVEATLLRYDGMVHGFFTAGRLFDAAGDAVTDAGRRLGAALAA